MVKSGGIEPFIDTITLHNGYCLPTSPEISLKKIFSLRESSSRGIYEIAHAFRNDRAGKLHLQEFTMIEWYRKDCEYNELVNDVTDLIQVIRNVKPAPPLEKSAIVCVDELFENIFKVKPQANWGFQDYHELALQTKILHAEIKTSSETEALHLNEVFTLLYDHAVIQLSQSAKELVFIKDYPWFLRGMAKLNSAGWAMRVEAYLHNLELCSGYQELDDADELREVWEYNNQIRKAAGKEIHPLDVNLIHNAKSMTGVSGMALGLERTIMASFNIPDIREFMLHGI